MTLYFCMCHCVFFFSSVFDFPLTDLCVLVVVKHNRIFAYSGSFDYLSMVLVIMHNEISHRFYYLCALNYFFSCFPPTHLRLHLFHHFLSQFFMFLPNWPRLLEVNHIMSCIHLMSMVSVSSLFFLVHILFLSGLCL